MAEKPKYFFIYETTNALNGKKYRGVHVTKKLEDGYIGSGVLLKKAIAKYGKQNFTRKILEMFDSKEEAYSAERNYVDEKWIASQKTYNLKLGGMGGSSVGRVFSDTHKARISTSRKGKSAGWTQNKEQAKEVGKKISEAKKGIFTGNKKYLSQIQENKKLVYNLETNKRYWIDKNIEPHLPEIPAKVKKAIDLYNTGKRVSATGIKKKDLPSICEDLKISHLLNVD